jgi:hypothetical protein
MIIQVSKTLHIEEQTTNHYIIKARLNGVMIKVNL